jgi:mannose-6-phosphate isomerase-like protein (cupin superfamily)
MRAKVRGRVPEGISDGRASIIVLPGQAPVSPGRSVGAETAGRSHRRKHNDVEETVPAGTKSTYHPHHDSDEVAYVLSGEVTFAIGDEVTVGGPGICVFMPRGVPYA